LLPADHPHKANAP